MKQTLRMLVFIALLSTAAVTLAQAVHQAKPTAPAAPAAQAAATHASAVPSAGEQAFQNHCSRCHYAPEDLNPRFTGTVVRHMRVRANLSAEDERLIMSFFQP